MLKPFHVIVLGSSIVCPSLHAEELHVRGDRLFLPIEIAGHPVEALLDSGAEVTVLDREFAEEIDTGEGHEVEAQGTGSAKVTARLVENLPIRALGRDVTAEVAAVMDLSEVGSRLLGNRLPVVLGREIFDAGRLVIDIDEGKIDWFDAETIPPGTRLPLTGSNGIETVEVRFGDTMVSADFDLGNGTGLLISGGLAERMGLEPAGVEPGGGIGGAKGRAVVYVPELSLAGRTFRHVRAHVDPEAQTDANIGVEQLRAFRIVTDFSDRSVWLDARAD